MKNSYTKIIILLSITASAAYCMDDRLKNFHNVFLNSVENKTGKNLTYFLNDGKFTSTDLPKKLQFTYGPRIFVPGKTQIEDFPIKIDIRDTNNPTIAPFMYIEKFGDDTVRSILYYRTATAPITSSEVTHTDIKINPDEHVYISIILEGNKLEKSKIEISKRYQPKSLTEQSVKSVAEKIKQKKLSLEQAKKLLPTDLHHKLELELSKLK